MVTLTTDQKNKLRRLRDDPRWYVERFLQIRDKEARIVPLHYANNQAYYYERYWKPSRDAGLPIRDFILKPRQSWMSTGVGSLFFQDTVTRKNVVTEVVSHEEDSVDHLFGMHRLFFDLLPAPLKPMRRYSNRKELVFENPDDDERPNRPGLRSKISVSLARNIRAGHSKTRNNVHLSEAALYPHFTELVNGFIPSVPNKPNTAIVIETTASHVGSEAHRFYQRAKLGPGHPDWNGFRAVFIAWYSHAEYVIPFASDEDRASFLRGLSDSPDQGMPLTAKKLYGLTPEQLHWRQMTGKQFDTWEAFFQQYPENDVDCWLSTGSAALPVADVRAMQQTTKPPKWRGYLETYIDDKDPKNPVEKIRFVDDPKGPLRLWKLPKPEGEYIVAADTSEGYAGGDYSSVDVFDKENSEQVAQWHGHIDPDLLGSEVLPNLGWYFRSALVGVERNGPGLVTLVALKRSGYTNIYRSTQLDQRTNKQTKKLGWLTTRQSKPLLVDEIRQRLRERSCVINSSETLDEYLTFVRLPDGSTAAQENCRDDRVISSGIGLVLLKLFPFAPPRKARRPVPKTTYDAVTGY
jgi:hypothetical protein